MPEPGALTAGERIVAERADVYGEGTETLQVIANLWADFLGRTITIHEVCLMMALLKIAREHHRSDEDNLNDIEGYVALARTTL